MATRPPPSSLQANAFEAASPSSSFDDIDTLVTWPTLEQFMEDLSDLDEQDNSHEKLDRQGPSVQDMFAARERDVAASSDMFGNLSRREVLPTRLPTSTYQTWNHLALSCLALILLPLAAQLDASQLANATRADAMVSSQISSLMRERAESGGQMNMLGSYRIPGLATSPPLRRAGGISSPSSARPFGVEFNQEEGDADTSMHQKQRFVWSPDLHKRFEAAVAQLGIEAAKPQAISQLMGVHGENAPTRQNIKSHLQKYRLLMKKRAANGSSDAGTVPSVPPPPKASPSGVRAGNVRRSASTGALLKGVPEAMCDTKPDVGLKSDGGQRRVQMEEKLYKLDGLPPLRPTSQMEDDLNIEMHELGDIPMEALMMLDEQGSDWPSDAGSHAPRPDFGVMDGMPKQPAMGQGPLHMPSKSSFQQGVISGQALEQGELNLSQGFRNSLPQHNRLPGSYAKAPAAADASSGGTHDGRSGQSSGMGQKTEEGVPRVYSNEGSVATVNISRVSEGSSQSEAWMTTWRAEDLQDILDASESGVGGNPLPLSSVDENKPSHGEEHRHKSDGKSSLRTPGTAEFSFDGSMENGGKVDFHSKLSKNLTFIDESELQLGDAETCRDKLAGEVEASVNRSRLSNTMPPEFSPTLKRRRSR
ncbi:MAG: hypothetical protein SGPRY_005360, partial [Prymnesium sp.]